MDFQFDTTTDGRTLKLLHVVDEHTREALAIHGVKRFDGEHLVRGRGFRTIRRTGSARVSWARCSCGRGRRAGTRVARSIAADHAVRLLDQIVHERGAVPDLVRMDNGPEMTANAVSGSGGVAERRSLSGGREVEAAIAQAVALCP